MHNGLIASLSMYLIKYLNEFFVPCGSSLESNILLTPMSTILVTFLFLVKFAFFDFLVSEIYDLATHSYTRWKKSKKFL